VKLQVSVGNHRPDLPHVHLERFDQVGDFAVINNHILIGD